MGIRRCSTRAKGFYVDMVVKLWEQEVRSFNHAAHLLFLPRMHIRFTVKELETLVEMLSLAVSVSSWNQKEGSDGKLSGYEGFESRMLEKAAANGLGEMIEFDAETQRFRVKKEVEEKLFYHECYEEFRNESFWDELTVRLADRDLVKSIGLKAWEAMTEEQRRTKTVAWEKRYWQEFSKNGIERVIVMTPPGEG